MLQEMRLIAIDYIYKEIGDEKAIPNDLNKWYEYYSRQNLNKIVPYLTEQIEEDKKIVLFTPDSNDNDLINVTLTEVKNDSNKYPYIKGSSRGAQIGPVIKIGIDKGRKISPKPSITELTLKTWSEIAVSSKKYSKYFQNISIVMSRNKINVLDKYVTEWSYNGYHNPIDCFLDKEGKNYINYLLVIKDTEGMCPGESTLYSEYLQDINHSMYTTKKAVQQENCICSLCQKKNVIIFSNGVKGAGINISNVDRDGAFSNLDINNAWKNFGICKTCADLLFIYKNHVLKRNHVTNKRPFHTRVAGESALIIPSIRNEPSDRQKIIRRIFQTVDHITTDIDMVERRLWNVLKTEQAILNINIYWLTIGQDIEDLRGSITDIPPTRLKELSLFNESSKDWNSPIFPKIKINSLYSIDLSLNSLRDIFKRPGGKRAKIYNASENLSQLLKYITKCIYYKTSIDEKRFWEELMITAKMYLEDAVKKDFWWGIVNEGSKENGNNYLTFAGWIRHLSWWLYYFKKIGVMKMDKTIYEPKTDLLRPYFSEGSGIDSLEKAFAFTLGILFGRLITLQGGRGINVSANALTWLKRLTLKGIDLPELYVKTREKLLAYDAESNEKVREVIKELGHIGMIIGDKIELDSVSTNYFLLLGQSISSEIIPTKNTQGEK